MMNITKSKITSYGTSRGMAKAQSNTTRTSTAWKVEKIDENGHLVIDKYFPMYFGTKKEAQEYVKNFAS